jgi:hypothetical protein
MFIIFLAISLTSIRFKNPTYDEVDHFQYGVNIFYINAERIDDSKKPLSVLNALPEKVFQFLPPKPAANAPIKN